MSGPLLKMQSPCLYVLMAACCQMPLNPSYLNFKYTYTIRHQSPFPHLGFQQSVHISIVSCHNNVNSVSYFQHALKMFILSRCLSSLFQHTEWKLHRQAVLRCIEQFLEKPQVLAELPSSCQINKAAWERCVQALLWPEALNCSQAERAPLLLLLDDNFYYPSMRYEVYQLARKCKHSAFFSVYSIGH